MATIILKKGDFGGDITVTVGEAALYLPDRSRPGLNESVPLTAIEEIEALSDDRSGQLKQAAKLGARGFLTTGNPIGLAASVFAVTKVKDIEFEVRLKDGRRFVATADAGTYANLRGACNAALISSAEDAEAEARANAVIAKYLGLEAPPPEEDAAPAPEELLSFVPPAEPEVAESGPAQAAAPPAFESRPAKTAEPPAADLFPGRRVFGRRGLR